MGACTIMSSDLENFESGVNEQNAKNAIIWAEYMYNKVHGVPGKAEDKPKKYKVQMQMMSTKEWVDSDNGGLGKLLFDTREKAQEQANKMECGCGHVFPYRVAVAEEENKPEEQWEVQAHFDKGWSRSLNKGLQGTFSSYKQAYESLNQFKSPGIEYRVVKL